MTESDKRAPDTNEATGPTAPIKVACFDLDGTLSDNRVGIFTCMEEALAGLGRTAPPRPELHQFIGPPLIECFETMLDAPREDPIVHEAMQRYRDRYQEVGLYENQLYGGVRAMLARLRAHHWRLYVVTSKPAVYAQRIIEHFGLTDHFIQVYGPGLDGSLNHKAELLAHVLAHEGLVAEQCVMIGDRAHDMIAASANQVRALGVLWGFGSDSELRDHGAAACLASPNALATLLIEGSA